MGTLPSKSQFIDESSIQLFGSSALGVQANFTCSYTPLVLTWGGVGGIRDAEELTVSSPWGAATYHSLAEPLEKKNMCLYLDKRELLYLTRPLG